MKMESDTIDMEILVSGHGLSPYPTLALHGPAYHLITTATWHPSPATYGYRRIKVYASRCSRRCAPSRRPGRRSWLSTRFSRLLWIILTWH